MEVIPTTSSIPVATIRIKAAGVPPTDAGKENESCSDEESHSKNPYGCIADETTIPKDKITAAMMIAIAMFPCLMSAHSSTL